MRVVRDAGGEIWKEVSSQLPAAPSSDEMSPATEAAVSRVMGFGDYIASYVCGYGSIPPGDRRRVRTSTALLNFLIAFADKIVDGHGENSGTTRAAQTVASLIGKRVEGLRDWNTQSARPEAESRPKVDDDVRLFEGAMRLYLDTLPAPQSSPDAGPAWAAYRECNNSMIRAEETLRSTSVRDEADLESIEAALWNKSTLPIKSLVTNGLLYSDGDVEELLEELDATTGPVGNLFWLVDDLADVADDLKRGQWNACVVEMLRQGGSVQCTRCGRPYCPSHAATSLANSDAIEQIARRAAARCDEAARAMQAQAGLEDTHEHLIAWIDSWLGLSRESDADSDGASP